MAARKPGHPRVGIFPLGLAFLDADGQVLEGGSVDGLWHGRVGRDGVSGQVLCRSQHGKRGGEGRQGEKYLQERSPAGTRLALAAGLTGSLRTHFGQGDQEMGGLKPGARSALAKCATAAAGCDRSNGPVANDVPVVTGPTAEHAWQWEQVGHEKEPPSPAPSSLAGGASAWWPVQSSWPGTATAPLSDECAGATACACATLAAPAPASCAVATPTQPRKGSRAIINSRSQRSMAGMIRDDAWRCWRRQDWSYRECGALADIRQTQSFLQ